MAQKITPCLWFDKNCEEAINFYIEVFNGAPHKSAESKILSIKRYEKGMEVPVSEDMTGKIITAIFELNGQRFIALDGEPIFKFSEATSLVIDCEDQGEVDYFWDKMSADPEFAQCGWIKDKFGLSWQIIPSALAKYMSSPDPVRSQRVMQAMLKMKKMSIKGLEKAYKGK